MNLNKKDCKELDILFRPGETVDWTGWDGTMIIPLAKPQQAEISKIIIDSTFGVRYEILSETNTKEGIYHPYLVLSKTLTPLDKRKIVMRPKNPDVCPICKSTNVSEDRPMSVHKDKEVAELAECLDCHSQWDIVYKYNRIEVTYKEEDK